MDGQAARALGQTSKFGAVLDMVTDRYASFFLCIDRTDAYWRCTTGVFTLLPFLSISGLRVILPISYRFGFQQPLYAYVQVCLHLHLFGFDSLMIWGKLSRNRIHQP